MSFSKGKRCLQIVSIAIFVACAFVNTQPASAQWTNGQAADIALGAPDLNTAGNVTISASRFNGPTAICTDPTSGKVFVVIYNESRILRFTSEQSVTTDGVAEAVFGQPDFTTAVGNIGGISASTLWQAEGCAIDSAGNLFVTDTNNNRVLRYDNAATKPSGAAADGVLGQPDFTSTAAATTASSLGGGLLYGITIDGNDSLYVADIGNNRVLRFDNAASKANGGAADGVLGAPDFTTPGVVSTTASTFVQVYGLAVDSAGNLFVADDGSHRILRFDNAASKPNGAAADGVLGVPDFTTVGSLAVSASTFGDEIFNLFVYADTLYVPDFSNNRVLIFNDAANKANGADADYVLGQPDFTSSAPALSASGFEGPAGVGVNEIEGYLLVSDYYHDRVMGFYNAELLPVPVPTVSEWGMIIMAFILGLFGVYGIRRRKA